MTIHMEMARSIEKRINSNMPSFRHLVLFALILTPAPSVFGDDTDAQARAEAAFQEGVSLYRDGSFTEAADAFRRANRLRMNWKILYNIGQSEASAKRSGLALQAFEEYLTRGGDDVSIERRDQVLQEIRRLKLLVGHLEIDAPDGAAVLVDGDERERTPLEGPVMISAGVPHQIKIVLGDETLLERTVRVSGGTTQKLVVEPPRAESTPAAPQPPPKAEPLPTEDGVTLKNDSTAVSRTPRWVAGITTAALGGALVVAGGALGGVALSKGIGLESNYPNGIPQTEHGETKTVDNMALAADILIGAGAVAAVTGTILLILDRRHRRHAEDASVQPAIGIGAAGVTVRGTF